MASSSHSIMTKTNNKRTLEERNGLDQLVKGMTQTGITRAPAADTAVQLSTKDFMNRNLYGYGSTDSSSNGCISSKMSSVDNVHSIFAAGMERRRREAYCLGYGGDKGNDAESSSSEPRVKRRRFQRRNSKTPAMLFKAMNILPQDLFTDVDASAVSSSLKSMSTPAANSTDDADWDSGLEIAEQLVKQLQQRRMSDASVSAR